VNLGTVTGRIVDSETMRPLENAAVQLDPVGPARGATGAVTRRSAITDSLGGYRFTGVRPGLYSLIVRRIGYVPRRIDVDLREASSALLSLALEVDPVLLPPVKVRADPTQPFTQADRPSFGSPDGEAAVLRGRQATYMAGDVRELTQAEVVQSVTLAETDVFRALQRMPGVSTRDDYTATLWTRGATWDQTRIYFDGLPLYNPTHAGWLFAAVNPDAIGSATFHPGMRSAKWGEGAAAVLDLRSRSGGEGGSTLRGSSELSLASARLALDGQSPDGRFGWMIAGRRTYVDLVSSIAGAFDGRDEGIPYDFGDVVARVDGRLGQGWSYMASGILEQDNLRGDVPGLLRNNKGKWGNDAGQITVGIPLGSKVRASVQTGQTHFRAAIQQRNSDALPVRTDPTLPPLETVIRHGQFGVEIRPVQRDGRPAKWGAGFQIVRDSVRYKGPFPLLSELASVLPVDTTNDFQNGSGLGYRAFWGERRFAVGRPFELETGVRVETGDSVLNGGSVRVAPRIAGRLQLPDGLHLSAAWARSYQYTQDIAPVAGPLGPQLHLTHLWVQAQATESSYPAVRADILTVGAEKWLSEDWLAAVNVYDRHATGVEIPNPQGGRVAPDRDPDANATNEAYGVELSARRVIGSWTAAFGYTYGNSRMHVLNVVGRDTVPATYPSSADVRHALDLSGMTDLGRGVRLGGAFTFGSGVPYTRLILPELEDPSPQVEVSESNIARTPAYASLDLLLEYTRTEERWQMTGYLQLRNALDRDNCVTYVGSRRLDTAEGDALSSSTAACTGAGEGVFDHFERGIPRLPLIGVRVTF
jgi:hypothetical protein